MLKNRGKKDRKLKKFDLILVTGYYILTQPFGGALFNKKKSYLVHFDPFWVLLGKFIS